MGDFFVVSDDAKGWCQKIGKATTRFKKANPWCVVLRTHSNSSCFAISPSNAIPVWLLCMLLIDKNPASSMKEKKERPRNHNLSFFFERRAKNWLRVSLRSKRTRQIYPPRGIKKNRLLLSRENTETPQVSKLFFKKGQTSSNGMVIL